MPVSTLPCPSRSSGLSRLVVDFVVDLTTRPLYQPETIFKPHLNHLPTNIHRSIPNFILWLVVNCLRWAPWEKASLCLEFVLIHVNSWLRRFWFWPGAHGLLSALSQQKCGLSQCPSLMTSVHGGISPKLLLAPHVLTRTAWVRYNSDRLMSGKCGEKPPLPRNCNSPRTELIATGT